MNLDLVNQGILDPKLCAMVFMPRKMIQTLRFVSYISEIYPERRAWAGKVSDEAQIIITPKDKRPRVFPHHYYRIFCERGYSTPEEFHFEKFEWKKHGDLILKSKGNH